MKARHCGDGGFRDEIARKVWSMFSVSSKCRSSRIRVALLVLWLSSAVPAAGIFPAIAAEGLADPTSVPTLESEREASPLGAAVDGEDVDGDPGSEEETVVNEEGKTIAGEDAEGGGGSEGGNGGNGTGGNGVEAADVDVENDGTLEGGDGDGGDGDGIGSGGDGNGGDGIEATTVEGENDGEISGGDGTGGDGGTSGIGGDGNGGDGIAAQSVNIDNSGTIEGGDGNGGDGTLSGTSTGGDGIDAATEVVVENSGTIAGGDGDEAGDGIASAGDVTVTTNTGTIVSGDGDGGDGIEAGGNVTIGTNASDGQIRGGDGDGIDANGSVEITTNSGTVSGGDDGIHAGGDVTVTTNNGLIQGTDGDGIQADGGVAVGTNTGDIIGGDDGIDANGNVSVGTNTGLITGGDDGIDATGSATIGINTGLISGTGDDGISASSVVVTTNLGAIIGADDGISSIGAVTVTTNDGLIQGTSGDGIVSNGGVSITTNSGIIQGNDDGIQSATTVLVNLNALDGLIQGGDDGINAGSTVTIVTNAGTIQGNSDDGINTDGSVVIGTNSGTIVGGDDGINADGSVVIGTNSGTIVGGDDGINADGSVVIGTNSGTIVGGDDGINADGSVTITVNTGAILGTADDAINADGSVTVTTNSGLIQGGDDGITADGNITIGSNTELGTIQGGDHAINADFNVTITSNDGTIQGGALGDGIHAGGNVSIGGNSGTIVGGDDGIDSSGAVFITSQGGTIQGVVGDGINAGTDVVISNNTGDILGGSMGDGIEANGSVTILQTNAGTISGTDDGIDAGTDVDIFANTGEILGGDNGVLADGKVTIGNNSGIIVGGTSGIVSSAADITNSGLIAGGEDGIATVLDAAVTNQAGGVIVGDADLDGSGDGLDIGAGSVVVNEAGARICAGVSDAICNDPLSNLPAGPATDAAGIRVSGSASLDNAGIIVAQGAGIAAVNLSGTVTINNNDGGIIVGGGGVAILGGNGTQVIFNNAGGTIAGDVVLAGGDDAFHMETGSDLLGNLDMGTTRKRYRKGGGGEADIVRLFGLGTDAYAGNILGAEFLAKDDSGTWSLDGDVDIGVSTEINGGVLSIGGLLDSPTVDVKGGGALAGEGMIVGNVFALGDSTGRGGVAAGGVLFDHLEDDPLYGSIAPGVSVGTLFVDGNVFFDGPLTALVDHDDDTGTPDVEKILSWGGRYEADIEAGGDHDVLHVTGTTNLGGLLDILLDPEFQDSDGDGNPDVDGDGYWIPTADFTDEARIHDIVVSEGGVIGEFDQLGFAGGGNDGAVVVHPDNPKTIRIDETVRVPMFKGFLSYMPDRVRIVSIPAFGPRGETRNQVATGSYIDSFTRYGLNTDTLHEAVSQLGLFFSPSSLDQLNPERYNAINEIGFSVVRGTVAMLENRGWEMQGSPPGQPTGLWLAGSWNASEVDADEQLMEYEFDTASTFLGFDRRIADGVLLGVVGSLHDSTVEYGGLPHDADVQSLAIAGYVNFSNGTWFMSAGTGVGTMEIDSAREISLGPTSLTAAADYDAEYAFVHAKGGRGFDLGGGWWAGPALGVTLTEVEQDAFVESGAAELNLAVARQSHDSLRVTADVRISKTPDRENGARIVPHFTIGVSHEFKDDPRPITAAFTGAGGGFTVFGLVPRKTAAVLGAGISATVGDRWTLFLDYTGEVGNDSSSELTSHEIAGGARVRF